MDVRNSELLDLDIEALEREGHELLELEKLFPKDDPIAKFTPDKLKRLHDKLNQVLVAQKIDKGWI